MSKAKPYIIFLRGVMPFGKNKVPMALLRQALIDAGFLEVATYIQSGNVLLSSELAPLQIEKRIHEIIEKTFGGDIAVVARTPLQVKKMFQANPFSKADTTKVFFTLLQNKPDAKKVKDLLSIECPPDEFLVTNDAIYLHCPVKYGTTKFSNNFFEKKLGVSATSRNHRTITKLIELS